MKKSISVLICVAMVMMLNFGVASAIALDSDNTYTVEKFEGDPKKEKKAKKTKEKKIKEKKTKEKKEKKAKEADDQ